MSTVFETRLIGNIGRDAEVKNMDNGIAARRREAPLVPATREARSEPRADISGRQPAYSTSTYQEMAMY